MATKKLSSNFGTRALISLLGATTMVCQTPLFSNTFGCFQFSIGDNVSFGSHIM